MATCMAQRGFLTLSTCDEPATWQCAACGRWTCPLHLSPSSGMTKCLECANAGLVSGPEDDAFDGDWSHRQRNTYYAGGYRPLTADDARGFDHRGDHAIDGDDDQSGGGFGDS